VEKNREVHPAAPPLFESEETDSSDPGDGCRSTSFQQKKCGDHDTEGGGRGVKRNEGVRRKRGRRQRVLGVDVKPDCEVHAVPSRQREQQEEEERQHKQTKKRVKKEERALVGAERVGGGEGGGDQHRTL